MWIDHVEVVGFAFSVQPESGFWHVVSFWRVEEWEKNNKKNLFHVVIIKLRIFH